MQVTVQRISPVLMELQVEVPAQTVKSEIDKAYTNLAKRAHVKGFRPGKAPRSVLSHLYGAQVQVDVASAIVNDTLPKVLSEKKVTPVSRPSVEPGKFSATEAFSYKARFEVQPEITDVKYEGFELFRPKVEATGEMVDEQMEALRVRHSTLRAPEPGRPVQKGDAVTIDFTITVDGTEVKDGGGQGVQLELGGGQVLPELEAALLGKSPGDTAKAEVTFPDAHPRPEFRGKKGLFKVTLTDVKERVLPALDDEFAKDVGQFQTIVELRADVHTRIEQALKDQADQALAEQVVGKLNEANPLEVPPSLVEQQCRIMEGEFVAQARKLGQKLTKDDAAKLHDRIHAEAERKVRAGLLMAAIAKKHELKVTEEDIDKGIAEIAQQTGKNVAKVKAEYREQGKRDMLIGMIIEDKVLDLLESKSKIKEGPVPAAASAGKAGEDDETGASKKKKKKAEG